jgi:hypothetical protein
MGKSLLMDGIKRTVATSSTGTGGSMLFNFLTTIFTIEKKNWDAATSNNPLFLATVCETCPVHRVFTGESLDEGGMELDA